MRLSMLCAGCLVLGMGCTGTVESTPPPVSPGVEPPDGPPSDGGTERPPPEMPPARPAPTGQEFACTGQPEVGPAVTPRRTRLEIARVLEDALGIDIRAAVDRLVPADLRADGFSNQAGGQVLTVEHIEAFESLAAEAADSTDLSALYERLQGNCDGEEPCRSAFVEGLARALWGRAPADVSMYLALFSLAEQEGIDTPGAAGLVLQAMIQSPDFLYPLDRAGPGDSVVALALARRLAQWVWLSGPDEALVQAAESGELETEAEIESQVRRMLSDPRARSASQHYAEDWLHLDRLETLNVDLELYPNWSARLSGDMRAETLRFFDYIAWEENRPLEDLFDAQLTVVSNSLAELYGLPEAQDEASVRRLDDVSERGGLLTQGSLLTVGGNRASLVERGLFVLETLLCGQVESPPVDVVMEMGEVREGVTQRTFAEQRMASDTCGGCHRQMDPLAFALERFSGVGGYAVEDRFGNQLRSDGEMDVPGDPVPIPYADVAELASALADHPRVRECFVLKTTQYALGRRLVMQDSCHLASIKERFEATPRTWPDLVVAVATSSLFRAAGAP